MPGGPARRVAALVARRRARTRARRRGSRRSPAPGARGRATPRRRARRGRSTARAAASSAAMSSRRAANSGGSTRVGARARHAAEGTLRPWPVPEARRRARPRWWRSLAELYPDARCALAHANAYQLLVATILSAQCTDERVNMVTPALFARYPDARPTSPPPTARRSRSWCARPASSARRRRT